MAHSAEKIKAVMEMYRSKPDISTKDLAARFGVSASTVIAWANKAKVRRRPRGRRPQVEPTARHRHIVELAKTMTCPQIGKKLGITKQAVHRVVARWANWVRPDSVPYKPGDVVQWKGKKYTILEAGLYDGNVVDSSGRTIIGFSWTMKGEKVEKIGRASNKA